MAGAQFDNGNCGLVKQPRQIGRQSTVGLEAVDSAIKRDARIVLRNLGRQAGDRLAFYIGWVGHDCIERAGNRRPPRSDNEPAATSQPQRGGVAASHHGGVRHEIDTDPGGRRQFAQQREQQTARPGAEIEQPQRGAAVAYIGERRFDQGFAVGPRDQRLGRQREIEAPELAPAQHARGRLARCPACQEPSQASALGSTQHAVGVTEDDRGIDSERRCQQQPRLASRLLDGGRSEELGRLGERRSDGGVRRRVARLRQSRADHSISASRAARSSASRGSMISSRASPLITLSIL